LDARAQAVIDFWFGPRRDPARLLPRKAWFETDPGFDAALRERFLTDQERAQAGTYDRWMGGAESCLALVLLLDQMPRNLFRGTPRAFASDGRAREVARHAVAQGFDAAMPPVWRCFFYLPFEHSEELADQEQSLALFARLPTTADFDEDRRYAARHHEIIARFGRFPHRNAILGRVSTPQEEAFLKEPFSAF
jgi:uncharacterized protein (DUF924 family)